MNGPNSDPNIVRIGRPLPRLVAVAPRGKTSVAVTWRADAGRPIREVVDLAPDIFTYKFYGPLRDDPKLFRTVHVAHDGTAIAWGGDDEFDMPATSIERLADDVMTPLDFAGFLKESGLTYDAAAAQLGISRRLVAYYAKDREVPRHIALACAHLLERLRKPAAV
jgi:hypothetical protein